MNKLKLWNQGATWEEAETAWDLGAKEALVQKPLKGLKILPDMPGITPETAKNLKWKSLWWMITKDHDWKVLKGFLRHPLKYGWALLKSAWHTKPYKRERDFFYYGVSNLDQFKESLKEPNALFVVGFSYCHKPFECPSGRFTDQCKSDPKNAVCRQCFIGKAVNALDSQALPVFIPTIHYIGAKIFEVVHQNPGKKVLFMITACEMTLEMFGDWGNMVAIEGIGVRLDGRICNTMKAFELSEQGIKPGLTVVLDETQKKMLEIIRWRRDNSRDGPKGQRTKKT